MEYVYGAMLLHSAGKEITEDSLNSVLGAANVEADKSRVKALIASLEDVNIEEAIATAAVAAAPAAAAPAAAEAAPAAAEEKKEEKSEEEEAKKEEEAAEGLASLFG